jgi:hypothetical protein
MNCGRRIYGPENDRPPLKMQNEKCKIKSPGEIADSLTGGAETMAREKTIGLSR